MREHLRIVVHVRHPSLRIDSLRDLVHIIGGRQAGAEVKELVDAKFPRHVADRADQAGTIVQCNLHRTGELVDENVTYSPVDGKVVFSSEQVIVGPGNTRYFWVKGRRHTRNVII